MAVYVDDMRAKFGRMVMCHMIADTLQELHDMADKIGVQRKWYQGPPKTRHEHYDIALSKRGLAIENGAIAITWKQCSAMSIMRRETGRCGTPEEALAWLYARAEKRAARTAETQAGAA